MNAPVFLDRADGFIAAANRESRTPWVNRIPHPFITISRECCAGGSSLAQLLAAKLSGEERWEIYGGNLINRMLQTFHLPEQLARFLPEDTVPELSATIGEMVGLHPNLWELVQNAKATTQQLAKKGHVILVGRGANFATESLAEGIHVRLIAPIAHRARYYANRFNISEEVATVHNAKCDAARRRYVASHFGTEIADPAAYDLVINTAQVPLAEAVDIVVNHLHARTHAHATAA